MEKTEIKYSIKYSILKIIWNLVFVVLGFYLLNLIQISEINLIKISEYFVIIISIIFIYSFGKKIIFEILKFKDKIIFTKHSLKYDKLVFEWNNIKKLKVISKKEYTPKYKMEYEEFYLSFQYKTEYIEIKIDDYNTTVDEVKNIINRYNENSSFSKSNLNETKFENIIEYEDHFELNTKESDKVIKNTEKLCKTNIVELKQYCKQNLLIESNKISFIYYCLSENSIYWEEFLINEFLRVFEISVTENKISQLFPLLDNIIIDNINTKNSDEIRRKLIKELDNKNELIRFKSLELLSFWVDNETLIKNQYIISKLKHMLNDENWKIRWHINSILKENNIDSDSLNLIDQLKGKYLNTYKL